MRNLGRSLDDPSAVCFSERVKQAKSGYDTRFVSVRRKRSALTRRSRGEVRSNRIVVYKALKTHSKRSEARIICDAYEDCLFLQSHTRVMQQTLQRAERAALSDATILLIGESGTGKSLLARQIHLWSLRRAEPFVTIHCAVLPQQSHGGERSGWNFNPLPIGVKRRPGKLGVTEGGTLFLASIDDLPPPLQVELAQFMQDRKIDTAQGDKRNDLRIIAASSRDLVAEVKMHRFREDLFYNLSIISLRIPPLRERPADILPLALRMLAATAIRNRRGELHLSQEAATAMVQYRWPGNVRELQNAMVAAAVLCQGETITLANLPEAASKHLQDIEMLSSSKTGLDEMERQHILRALSRSSTLEQAAATLGARRHPGWCNRRR